MKIIPIEEYGYNFIEEKYIPRGEDEYYLRDKQFQSNSIFRPLEAREIEELVKNGNSSDNWSNITVTDQFSSSLIKNSSFIGRIRIEKLEPYYIEYHDFNIPVGIYNSKIISCDIGDNVSINNVDYLSHYIIRNNSVLFNINEISMSNHAKFGNGVVMEDEDEEVRVELEIANETGARSILPSDQLICPDAYIWQKYRGDQKLMDRFKEITQVSYITKRGYYGIIESSSVIKNCRLIKDCKIGPYSYIKGANKLKNLTIKSSKQSPTQIGEGVELVNGIIGEGCRIFYGVKAVRFQLMPHAQLKYGARLINSILGSNSTISCCEVLNSLIFPGHEQHHNNSFLIATVILGQSNIASAATIGSNHNSRGNDGEIIAGRGFWPGLSVNLTHNSRFASYNLISKGSYRYEINNPFPFSLLSQTSSGSLKILPGYWFLYNMYALARNSWKYKKRDKRVIKNVDIEYDFLAPDTVEEMIVSYNLLKELAEESFKKKGGAVVDGRKLLEEYDKYDHFIITAPEIENKNSEVVIDHPELSFKIYEEMIYFYCIKTLSKRYEEVTTYNLSEIHNDLIKYKDINNWVNIGGQLILEEDLNSIIEKIKSLEINSWDEIHEQYIYYSEQYNRIKASHALFVLLKMLDTNLEGFGVDELEKVVKIALKANSFVKKETRASREKDYSNPYRKITFDSPCEMKAVQGDINDNDFIKYTDKMCDEMHRRILSFKEKVNMELGN